MRATTTRHFTETFPTCPFCGEDNTLNLEVWGHDWMPGPFCCDALNEAVEAELEAVTAFEGDEGRCEFLAKLFELLTAEALPTRKMAFAKVNYELEFRVLRGGPDWRMACEFVTTHHMHHKPTVGWKFGVGAWNGDTLVGVAVVGRPVARKLDDGTVLEVTRLATTTHGTPGLDEWAALRREAASGMYRLAVEEAGRMGYAKVITYTLETESAMSVMMAKFKKDAVSSRGGSWNRPGRGRTDKAPTCPKTRWSRACPAPAPAH